MEEMLARNLIPVLPTVTVTLFHVGSPLQDSLENLQAELTPNQSCTPGRKTLLSLFSRVTNCLRIVLTGGSFWLK